MTVKQQLEKALGKMRTLNKDMEGIFAKADTLQGEDRKTLLETIGTKQAEYDALAVEAKSLKGLVEQQQSVDDMSAVLKPSDSDIDLNPDLGGKVHFEVDSSPAAEDRLKRSYFLQYCKGGFRSFKNDNEILAIQPKDQSRYKTIAPDGLCAMMPRSMVANIVRQGKQYTPTPDYASGKVVLSTDATGGATDSGAANLLAPDFRAQLIQMPVAIPTIFDWVQLVQAMNGSAEWPVLDQDQGHFGGVAFTWKATEGADKGETEPVFKDFTVNTHELSGWTEFSNTALRRSAIDLEAVLTALFRDAARYEWSNKIINGTGTNQPDGILKAGTITQGPARVADAQVGWADIIGLIYAVSKANRAGGKFCCSDQVEKYLVSQVDADDRPLFSADVHSPTKNLLAGYQYDTHEFDEPDLGDAGDIIFGNFQQYMFAVEEDIAIARSEHAEFKKGRIVFRLMCYVGGKVKVAKAFSRLPAYVAP